MESLKDFLNLEHWWKLVALAGVAIAIAGLARSVPAAFAGFGLLLFGAGMWANHSRESQKETIEGLQGFRIRDAYPWKPTAIGVLLSAAGVLLFGFGLYRLAGAN
ncbi:MAG: bacterial/archaeal transporter family-2 protein [Alphaproteobacteria bacterium]|jgi:hypothetical protein|nr:bacterial/archaeal transporter family-2 protein [Alphaproteobacteria bacterium]